MAVSEAIAPIAAAVKTLLDRGIAYRIESPDAAPDIYFDTARGAEAGPWFLGRESNLDRTTMLELSAERGGDPDRPGKRDPLDPLLWRSERPGEPAWDSPVGRGRPGWHIECTVIGLEHLTSPITVNGGGSDLIFPHHEYSAGHSSSLTGRFWSDIYSHAGMVAYQGEKMSKSLGNLVLVSRLVDGGVDPRVIRLALLAENYKSDWEWTDDAPAHRGGAAGFLGCLGVARDDGNRHRAPRRAAGHPRERPRHPGGAAADRRVHRLRGAGDAAAGGCGRCAVGHPPGLRRLEPVE